MYFCHPHFINEMQSDFRGIKGGWYAIEEDGKLSCGPFETREACVGGMKTAHLPSFNPLSTLSEKTRADLTTLQRLIKQKTREHVKRYECLVAVDTRVLSDG
jgi:hypothetical protein